MIGQLAIAQHRSLSVPSHATVSAALTSPHAYFSPLASSRHGSPFARSCRRRFIRRRQGRSVTCRFTPADASSRIGPRVLSFRPPLRVRGCVSAYDGQDSWSAATLALVSILVTSTRPSSRTLASSPTRRRTRASSSAPEHLRFTATDSSLIVRSFSTVKPSKHCPFRIWFLLPERIYPVVYTIPSSTASKRYKSLSATSSERRRLRSWAEEHRCAVPLQLEFQTLEYRTGGTDGA